MYMDNTVMIAMSGGVDSAVAAYLASKDKTAAGVTMQLAPAGSEQGKALARDIEDAARLCRLLGIPHFVADLTTEFRQHVIGPFIGAYEAGKTPNPCVVCNKSIKFGALMRYANDRGYGKLATGHYARIEKDQNGRHLLRRAADPTKDQSYVLYTLSQDVLSRVLFPLGDLTKAQVREIAGENGFSAVQKKESQDICFVPDGDYGAFIERNAGCPPKQGDFLALDGTVLGKHRGIVHYTVGQRKGLGISLGKPMFVISKSPAENTVTLGDNSDLFTTRLTVRDINLIPFERLDAPLTLLAKARYRQDAAPARVEQTGETELTVEFKTPQRAISPGQSLVLYDGDYVVGGGIIQ